jgi:peptidoglycan/xylan/chitin deacetylase (PgdA/CDA1 family)
LILTYHAVGSERSPLCTAPEAFRLHLQCIREAGARVVTVQTLARALRDADALTKPVVAITFDDGFQSVVDVAVPLLAEHGMTATLFCVAGHLGGSNDWPSGRPAGFRRPLATASALRELAQAGFEIGSHGVEHAPLVSGMEEVWRREVVDSRSLLEQAVGARVGSFAYPYGAGPSESARRLVEETYDAACSSTIGFVRPSSDPYALPRLEGHYLRRPELLAGALSGSLGPYLLTRRLGARARRTFRKDYLAATGRSGGPILPKRPGKPKGARGKL